MGDLAVKPSNNAKDSAFDDLYRANYRRLVLLAFVTTHSLEAAEDIVQDAFSQLYRRWAHVSVPGAWARRAVISLSTSWVRREVTSREAAARYADQAQRIVADALVPGAADVWSLLAALSPRQRAAVTLRYLEDLPEKEIAAAIGSRQGTVKSILSRAKAILREELP